MHSWTVRFCVGFIQCNALTEMHSRYAVTFTLSKGGGGGTVCFENERLNDAAYDFHTSRRKPFLCHLKTLVAIMYLKYINMDYLKMVRMDTRKKFYKE